MTTSEAGSYVGWQPMDAAPKDGTPVLCFWRNKYDGNEGWAVVQWLKPADSWMPAGWYQQGDDTQKHSIPDYWMALPESPK